MKHIGVILTCIFGVIFTILCPEIGMSQDSIAPKERVVWHKLEGSLGMTVNQLGITYWAAGGESNMSGKVTGNFRYTYNRKMFNYVTNGLFMYGAQGYTRTNRWEKTEDRLELSTTMTHNNNRNLTFTAMSMLKTQFTNGYSYPNDSVPISKFFAPAYLTVSIGYTYNIHNIVSIFFSPSAGKFTFVNDQNLADKGSFGVEAGYWNTFRFNPALKAEGKNPFTLDSKAPTADYKEFITGETRYSRLQQQFPERAEKLFAKAEEASKAKYNRLTKLVDLYSVDE